MRTREELLDLLGKLLPQSETDLANANLALDEAIKLPLRSMALWVIGYQHMPSYGMTPDADTARSQTSTYNTLNRFKPEAVGLEGCETGSFSVEGVWEFHNRIYTLAKEPLPPRANFDRVGKFKSVDGSVYYLKQNPGVIGGGVEKEHILLAQMKLMCFDSYKSTYPDLGRLGKKYCLIRTLIALTEMLQLAYDRKLARVALSMGALHLKDVRQGQHRLPCSVELVNTTGLDSF